MGRGIARRDLILGSASVMALQTFGAIPALAQAGEQKNWRYCGKYHEMFFDGYPDKGACPAGGGHAAIGFMFSIEYNARRTQEIPGRHRQYDWRFCNKCDALFYDGYSDKGVCPRGGGHVAQGYMFGLWDVSGPGFPGAPRQSDWRFCNKCHVLFFDGYPDKGRCPAGGGHVAQGLNFVIFHDAVAPAPAPVLQPPTISVQHQNGGFLVTGSGFLASRPVTVRVADDYAHPNLFLSAMSSSTGTLSQNFNFPCVQGGRLYFSANDGRKNPSDRTGALWSNTFQISC